MIKTCIFKILLGAWFVLCAPLFLVGLVSAGLTRAFVYFCAKGVVFLAWFVVGISYKIHGRIVPGAIVASKHMSILEIAALKFHYPDTFFIVKRELTWIPIYGWVFLRMGFVPVNRRKGATNMKELADRVACEIARGRTLVIFPEGTRVKPGAGVHLRRGLLFIAEALKIPIQPVGTDAGLYWPKRGRMRPGVANVWLEPALPYDSSLEEIAKAIAKHSV